MADPRQRSIDLPPALTRILPSWVSPLWTDAARWRAVVRNQPVAIICREKLTNFLQASPWDIRAKDSSEQDALRDDITYYKDFVFADFDTDFDMLWQDALDLPIGGNSEIVRWPQGVLPSVETDEGEFRVTREHPKGHVFNLVHIDGATLLPTYDRQFPLMQRTTENMTNPIFFTPNEVGRIVLTPRTEMQMKGFGMPPPQRIYLALTLLYRGDQYYANLLLDTPEAGILDLINMEKDAANDWVSSFGALMRGIDPFKVPVLYGHDKPAAWIPFGRPPTEMMFDSTTMKYARITAAGYWMTLADIGLEPGSETLAGGIRRQREMRLTGQGIVKEKTKNLINKQVLPPYLEFHWIEQDDEALSNRGRARLLNAQALKAMVEARIITQTDAQEQLLKDKLLSVELEAPPEPVQMLPAPAQNGTGTETNEELERVPPSQGGRGDIGVNRADLGSTDISAVPPGSVHYDQMAVIVREAFAEMQKRAGDAQLSRLIKAATRTQFEITAKSLADIDDTLLSQWTQERSKAWYGLTSAFDDIPDVQKADQRILDKIAEMLERDTWWSLPKSLSDSVSQIIKSAFAEGAVTAASLVQRFLYEEDLATSPDLIDLDFSLKNPQTIAEIEEKGAELVTRVNDGTKFYLKRIIVAGVDEGLSSPDIVTRIRDGESVETILRNSGFVETVIRKAKREIGDMARLRVDSIVNTEIARAETDGRVKQFGEIGLTRKRWAHTGPDTPCAVCQANIDLGFVAMDYKYDSVFGQGTVSGPPAHPTVDHCHIKFDEDELKDKAGSLNYWDGR